MNEITIIVPSIRTHLWERFLNSIPYSCKKYSFIVIFVGPFYDKIISNLAHVEYIESYATPTNCFQVGTQAADTKLILHTSDDSVFYEDAIDKCIDQFYLMNDKSVLNCRYREGTNFGQYEFPMAYWKAGTYPNVYGQKYVNPNWNLSLQQILYKDFFFQMGGFDCRFEFSNHAHADFAFRVQNYYGLVSHSNCEIANLEHLSDYNIDHKPVQDAQEGPDTILFNEIWNNEQERFTISYDTLTNNYWTRRFNKKYNSYEEMINDKS